MRNEQVNGWLRQIAWYEEQLKTEKDLKIKLYGELADTKERLQELESLLYVLTRHPEELDEVRRKLFRDIPVDKSKFEHLNRI